MWGGVGDGWRRFCYGASNVSEMSYIRSTDTIFSTLQDQHNGIQLRDRNPMGKLQNGIQATGLADPGSGSLGGPSTAK